MAWNMYTIHSVTHVYQTVLITCQFSAGQFETARVSNVDSRQFVESTFTKHIPVLFFFRRQVTFCNHWNEISQDLCRAVPG